MNHVSRILPIAVVLALICLVWANATAQNKPTPMNVTPEREAAVKTFVERNHPELAELLTHLKANKPQEYERAIRELHRITERLAGVQERDRAQYDLELKLWTAQSRVQLFTAKLRMDSTDELKSKLRDALNAQAEAKVALLKHERVRVADRLAKIDARHCSVRERPPEGHRQANGPADPLCHGTKGRSGQRPKGRRKSGCRKAKRQASERQTHHQCQPLKSSHAWNFLTSQKR